MMNIFNAARAEKRILYCLWALIILTIFNYSIIYILRGWIFSISAILNTIFTIVVFNVYKRAKRDAKIKMAEEV